jgi:ADP-heptose:LPS heptosyltransferase
MLRRIETAGRRALSRLFLSMFQPDTVLERVPECEKLDRILIMRWDAIGDMLVCLPLFREVRKLFPEAEVGLVVSKRNLPLLKHEEGFTTILYDRSPLTYLRSLLHSREFSPNAVVDTRMHYDSTTSFIYGIVTGARFRLSASNRDNRLPFSVRVPMPDGRHHYAHLTRILLEGLGRSIDESGLDRRLRLSAEETGFADRFWRDAGLSLRGKAVGVNISAGNVTRVWGMESTSDFCAAIAREGSVPLIFAAPADMSRAHAISSSVPECMVIPECPTILHAAALVEGLGLMVTPDTSFVHIAASFGVPVLGLFPHREEHMPLWYPWNVEHELIRTTTAEVGDIAVEDVVDGYSKLLSRIRYEQ